MDTNEYIEAACPCVIEQRYLSQSTWYPSLFDSQTTSPAHLVNLTRASGSQYAKFQLRLDRSVLGMQQLSVPGILVQLSGQAEEFL